MKKLLFILLLLTNISWSQQGNTVAFTATSAQEVLEVGGTGYFTANFYASNVATATKLRIVSWTVTISTNSGTIPGNIDGFNVNSKTYTDGTEYANNFYTSPSFYVQKTFSAAFGSDSPQNTKVTVSCNVKYFNGATEIAGSGTSGSYPKDRTVILRKVKAPTITNSAFGCGSGNVQVCATDYADADQFTWTITGATISSGQGTSCINVTPPTNSNFTTTCVVKRSNGLPNYSASTTKVINKDAFTTTATISGASTICAPTTSTPYTIANVGAGNTVIWSSSNIAVATISNPTPTSVTLNKVGFGNVAVIATITNSCGQTASVSKFVQILNPVIIDTSNFAYAPQINNQWCDTKWHYVEILFPYQTGVNPIFINVTNNLGTLPSQYNGGIIYKFGKGFSGQFFYDINFSNGCTLIEYTSEDWPPLMIKTCTQIGQNRTNANNPIKHFTVFPNPSNEIINIDLKDENNIQTKENTTIGELLDVMGQSKLKIEIIDNKATFSVKEFKKGIYLLKININDKVETHQIIVK